MRPLAILSAVAQIAQKDLSEIYPEMRLEDLNWDSLCDLSFLAKMDQVQGIEINIDALSCAKTVQDLIELVSMK